MKEPMPPSVAESAAQPASNIDNVFVDVVIIGAGISGINAGYRLKTQCPDKTFLILDCRDKIGGTWSFFKYPGLRSDSDLFTFGFPWRVWDSNSPIATGDSIMNYLEASVDDAGLRPHIRFNRKVEKAVWSDTAGHWNMTTSVTSGHGQTSSVRCRFFIIATGYYNYAEPLNVDIPGLDSFSGKVVHPQFWPKNMDYKDKRIVLIGSGATAITLLPVLAEKAAHVTMVQRSPSYVLSLPNSGHSVTGILSKVLPDGVAHRISRVFFMFVAMALYYFCRSFPSLARSMIKNQANRHMGGKVNVEEHFNPKYNPWDQRLCLCPDADFFTALKDGKATIETGAIESVHKSGVLVKRGVNANPTDQTIKSTDIPADIVITATGLQLLLGGGVHVVVNGQDFDPSKHFVWNGTMLDGLPNACLMFGYTNMSWTLGIDASAQLITRLITMMDDRKAKVVVPAINPAEREKYPKLPVFDLNSTYVSRSAHLLPSASDRGPWRARWNYLLDIWRSHRADLSEGLEFH